MMNDFTNALYRAEQHLQRLSEHASSHRLMKLRIVLDHSDLRLIVFGEFNKGKSTLINAILGRPVLPAKLIPTTGQVTRIVFGQSERVRVRFVDGRTESHGLDQLATFSTLNHNGRARDDIESIVVAVNCPLLEDGLVLVDTPGVNDDDAQTRRARDAIALADLVFLMLDARQLLSTYEQELAADWLTKGLGKAVIPVVNFMNFIENSDDRQEIRRRLDGWCREHLQPELGRYWFEVDALGALKHALYGTAAPGDDFPALRAALVACQGNRRRALQDKSRRGQIRYELRKAQERNSHVLKRLRADAAQVEREREGLRRDLQELARRFNADARLRCAGACTAAQKTLDTNLDLLVTGWFGNESKERLAARASEWYQKKLMDAVRDVEKEGTKELLLLAGDHLGRPEPLTVREKMIRAAQLDVGELPTIAASSSDTAKWAVVGGIVGGIFGTVFGGPGAGTAGGAALGAWLAREFGQKEADYVAAYSAKAREQWAEDTRNVLEYLHSEFDTRVAELKQRIDQRLEEVRPQSSPVEVSRREALEGVLAQCEQEI